MAGLVMRAWLRCPCRRCRGSRLEWASWTLLALNVATEGQLVSAVAGDSATSLIGAALRLAFCGGCGLYPPPPLW